MKLRKLLAGFVSAAMVMGTVALPAFADETPLIENTVEEVTENFETEPEEETNVVATYNGKNYSTLEEATAAAKEDKDPSRPVPRITLLTDNVDITKGQNYPVRYTMTAKNTTLSGDREWIKTQEYSYSNKMEIDVASSVSTITLDNMMGLYNLVLENGADVTLKLIGSNDVLGYITVPGGAKLTIKDVTEDSTGKLVVYNSKGKGQTLNAFGVGDDHSAAIGGRGYSDTNSTGEIVIKSGEIEAYSNYSAAIGGGQYSKGAVVRIEGGKVTAESGYGAAIGGGQYADCSITISGGIVNAKGSYGAAIGSGEESDAKDITITGGEITAIGGSGAAIGSGSDGNADGINITGGSVTASINTSGSYMGAAIGSGSGSNGKTTSAKNINISGTANVTVLPGTYAPISGSSQRITGYLGAAIGSGTFKWAGKPQPTGTVENVTIDTTGEVTVAESNVTFGTETSNITIKIGSFANDISDYAPKGTMTVENEDGTYTVKEAKARVTDTVKLGGMTITLTRLDKNEKIDLNKDMDVKINTSAPSKEDIELVNTKIAEENDTNTAKQIVDITPVANGEELGVTNQPVSITLTEKIEDGTKINVYHVNGATAEKVESTTEGNTVNFTASSFSTYAVTYTPVPTEQDKITTKVGVVFSPVDGTNNEYYINLKALDDTDKVINRFMSADLVFTNGTSTIDYEIEPALNMAADLVSVKDNSREYRFNMNGTASSGVTGSGITIGTIKFLGYGTLDFKIDNTYVSATTHVNVIQTAKADENIVDTYSGADLIINDAANNTDYPETVAADESGVISGEIAVEKKDLTVNVKFNNNAENQAKLYQDMHIVISGGNLANDIVYDLGSDNSDVKYAADASGINSYSVKVKDTLVKNTAYTVTVSGAGYRTARYTVTMTDDKVLNFWNNAKDNAAEVEENNAASARKVTFLAGDIVKDNGINIYDLSAVVSYFGTKIDKDAQPEYAKYDLNRDGVIDSKDVAYVLVSWCK